MQSSRRAVTWSPSDCSSTSALKPSCISSAISGLNSSPATFIVNSCPVPVLRKQTYSPSKLTPTTTVSPSAKFHPTTSFRLRKGIEWWKLIEVCSLLFWPIRQAPLPMPQQLMNYLSLTTLQWHTPTMMLPDTDRSMLSSTSGSSSVRQRAPTAANLLPECDTFLTVCMSAEIDRQWCLALWEKELTQVGTLGTDDCNNLLLVRQGLMLSVLRTGEEDSSIALLLKVGNWIRLAFLLLIGEEVSYSIQPSSSLRIFDLPAKVSFCLLLGEATGLTFSLTCFLSFVSRTMALSTALSYFTMSLSYENYRLMNQSSFCSCLSSFSLFLRSSSSSGRYLLRDAPLSVGLSSPCPNFDLRSSLYSGKQSLRLPSSWSYLRSRPSINIIYDMQAFSENLLRKNKPSLFKDRYQADVEATTSKVIKMEQLSLVEYSTTKEAMQYYLRGVVMVATGLVTSAITYPLSVRVARAFGLRDFWNVHMAAAPLIMNANAFVLGVTQGHVNYYFLTLKYPPGSNTGDDLLDQL